MIYECDKCGACCRHLLVEVDALDVLREPRLLDAQQGLKRMSLPLLLEDEDRCLIIAGPGQPCQFLGTDNHCQIYPTRPNICVGALAGEESCQQARREAGLPPLEPIEEVAHDLD